MKAPRSQGVYRASCAVATIAISNLVASTAMAQNPTNYLTTADVADTTVDSVYSSGNVGGVISYFGTNFAAGAAVAGDAGNSYTTVGDGTPEIDRGLLRFDLSFLPTNSIITKATLRMAFTGNNSGYVTTLSLYPVIPTWTEASASWLTRDGSNPWSANGLAAGVDYVATPSDSLTSAFQGSNTSRADFSFTNLAAAVQAWVNDPTSNHGWILINSNEINGRFINPTIPIYDVYPDKQFFLREWSTADGQTFNAMPLLDIQYIPEPASAGLVILGLAGLLARRHANR